MTISEESVGFPAGSDGKESTCYLRGIKDEKKKKDEVNETGENSWISLSLCLSLSIFFV